jgi:hypothetical protein
MMIFLLLLGRFAGRHNLDPLFDSPFDARFDDFSIYPSSCGELAATLGYEEAGFEMGEPEAHEVPLPPGLE